MGRLEQWRKGKPLGLVMVAEAAARGAEDCLQLLTMIREGDTFNAQAALPDQAAWLRLYHRHAAVGRSVRRSICAVLPNEVSSMVDAWSWLQRHPNEIKGIANSVSAADLAMATGRLKSLGGLRALGVLWNERYTAWIAKPCSDGRRFCS